MKIKLPDPWYDTLKRIAMIALDAVGICYKTVAAVWGLPFGEQVCDTCMALSVCLGTLLGISSAEYYKGQH